MADLIQIGVDVRTNIKQATADLDKMGGSVVNNINTINRLESEVAQLNRELNRGRVTEAAYAKGMRQINNELGLFQQRAAKAAEVERKFGQAAAGGGKSLNRFNMTLQQGGYQLQDFVVQLQSGTSFFTAFSQQGSQFASIFGPQGAVIGAVIAIGSAIGGMALAMFGASKDARTLEEAMDDLSESVDEYRDSIERANASSSEITEEFGLLSSQLRSVLKDFEELARIKVMDQLGVTIGKLRSEHISGLRGDLENIKNLLGVKGVFAAAGETVAQFNGTLKGLENSTLSLGERLKDAFTLRDLFLDNVGPINEMNEAQKAFYNDLLTTIEQLEKFQGSKLTSYEDILGSAEGLAAQEEALNEIFEARLGTIDDTANNYEDILGSAEGLAAQEQALNDLYEARLGTIDDTFNNYEDILGSEEGLKKAVDVLNQMYQDRLDKLQASADAYDDILGSEKGLLAAEEARIALNRVADSGYAGGRGGDPRDFSAYFDFVKQITDQEEERNKVIKKNTKAVEDNRTAYEKAMMTAQEFADALDNQVIQAVDGVADAFSDFLVSGLRDFKDFVTSIKDMFIRLLADMAAMALQRKILIPIAAGLAGGVGSAAGAATTSSLIAGGGTAGTLAAGASALGSGFMAGVQGFMGGGLSGYGATLSATAANAGTMATIGAAIPAVIAVAAVVGLLTKKVKELDSGIRVSIKGMDNYVETFRTTQSSRLFGLLKGSKRTAYSAVSDSPISAAVTDMQQSIVDAATSLGIASSVFDDFTYELKVSLKGLTEEQQLQKINEEISKMGDSFASLTGHFSNMNDLLAVAEQRYGLEIRLLQLQGNETEILIRQRERERAATHELNQGLLTQIYALEGVQTAVNNFKTAATNAFNKLIAGIQDRIEQAQAAVNVSRSILNLLESAGPRISMTREAGLSYLRGLRGASRITDEKKLSLALEAVAEPSEGLYSNFTDYQREFADTSNLIRELEEKAGFQLSNDERQLLQLQEEAERERQRHERQMEKMDQQLQALFGIDASVMTLEQAIKNLETARSTASAVNAVASGELKPTAGLALNYLKMTGDEDGARQILKQVMDNVVFPNRYASGGSFGGGLRIVGEQGPELEATGPSRVYSSNQTAKMLSNPELVEEVRSLRSEVAGLRSESRQLQASNYKYTKRNYDINRKWDTEGLPTTRT